MLIGNFHESLFIRPASLCCRQPQRDILYFHAKFRVQIHGFSSHFRNSPYHYLGTRNSFVVTSSWMNFIQKFYYNFTRCFVCVRNTVCHSCTVHFESEVWGFHVEIFQFVTPCSVAIVYGGPCSCHLQDEVKMEATWTSVTLLCYRRSARRHNPQDVDLITVVW